ncbi:MAG TPA: hypothetical protein PK054_04045 [Anaerohalosphaeraceae bacterium]|nr:hypothetical protein [Anaerohalosphaeraceae bacterium]HOL88892.1 hypothetical protein [Anaerohalosphaeraceae bacterium]HPP55734.1 hypothetical protein [Anaerohalosphaeraceae bacterium]
MRKTTGRELWGVVRFAWRVLSAIVRWSAVFLCSLLCSIGLAFHIPIKIIILLALIPLVAVVVPRKNQKWCWAAMAFAAIFLWLWIQLPSNDSAEWKTYSFAIEPIDNVPDNAADFYTSLVEKTRETVFSYPYADFEDQFSYAGPWKPEQFPALSRWMDECEPTLQQLMENARKPLCRFEVPGDPVRYQRQQLRIKVLKAWCSILLRSANRDLACGRLQPALEKQLTIVHIARHFYQQGTLLDQAGGYYLEEAAGRVLSRMIVEECTEPMLGEIEETLRQTDPMWEGNWPRILQREKLLARNIAALFYQENAKGQVRLSRDIGMGLHEVLGHPRYRLFSSEKFAKLAVLIMWFSMPASPQAATDLINERYDRYARMAEEGKDLEWVDTQPLWKRGLNSRSLVDWYAKRQVSYYYPLKSRNRQQKALRQAMALLMELRRFYLRNGRWPANLEELSARQGRLDPVSGEPFVYVPTQNGFRLYSIGINKRDDQGVNYLKEGKDDRLYWPTPRWEEETEGDEK